VTAIDSDGNTTQADSGTWWVIEGQARVFIPIVYGPWWVTEGQARVFIPIAYRP
jgi:hypothetical protein